MCLSQSDIDIAHILCPVSNTWTWLWMLSSYKKPSWQYWYWPLVARRDTIESRYFLLLQVQLVQYNGCLLLTQDNALCIVSLIIVIIFVVDSWLLLLLLKQVCYLLLLTLALKKCCQTRFCIQTLHRVKQNSTSWQWRFMLCFWDMTLCSDVVWHQYFGGPWQKNTQLLSKWVFKNKCIPLIF